MSHGLTIVPSSSPQEVRNFSYGKFEVYGVAGQVFGRALYEPGWRWSEHVGPLIGATLCDVAHVGVVVSGRSAVRMEDGTEGEMGPGDWFNIPPGHDSWVIGDEDYVSLHILGAQGYAAGPGDLLSAPAGTESVPLSSETVESQVWGEGCEGWLLLSRPSLHVMEEQMSPTSKEHRHLHGGVEQLYYILRGNAVVSLAHTEYPMSVGEAIRIAPGIAHQIRNDSQDFVRFLVISSAPPREDRTDEVMSIGETFG